MSQIIFPDGTKIDHLDINPILGQRFYYALSYNYNFDDENLWEIVEASCDGKTIWVENVK